MSITDADRHFMKEALALAWRAHEAGDVPVGCVIVRDGVIIASGYNRREADNNAAAHAEVNAIVRACAHVGSWRLDGCELYVTLEPCPMCAGAIINARVPRVIYGAPDPKAGAFGGLTDLNALGLNHKPEVTGGVLADECLDVLRGFFKGLRNK